MKHLFLTLMLLPALCMAGFNDHKYEIAVVDAEAVGSLSDPGTITSGVLTFVYTADSKTLATLYSDKNRTSLTNPISRSQFATDDKIQFYAAASSVDIVIAHSDGSIAKFSSVSKNKHRLPLDRSGVEKCLIVPYAAAVVETDTAIDLPLNVWVRDFVVEVVTADAGDATLALGLLSSETNGDANGFLTATELSVAGFIKPVNTTTGSTETYISTSNYGALMGEIQVGSNTASDHGQAFLEGHIVSGSNAQSVTYTPSATMSDGAGYVYIYFEHLR